MKCEDFLAHLNEIAELDPAVTLTPELREHLDCEECEQHYQEVVASWLMLAEGLDREPVQPELEELVMRQLAAAKRPPAPIPKSTYVGKYALAACILMALTIGTLYTSSWLGSNEQNKRRLAKVRELARQMERLEDLEDVFSSPKIKSVSLTSGTARNSVGGYLVHDFLSAEAHFLAYNLSLIHI